MSSLCVVGFGVIRETNYRKGMRKLTRSCSISAAELDDLLLSAKQGCDNSEQRLYTWFYDEGLVYFRQKVTSEALLTYSDAEDLAGESLLEFQKALPRVRTVTRYARRMFKNNLIRFLAKSRNRKRRECLEEDCSIRPPHPMETQKGRVDRFFRLTIYCVFL